MWLRFVVWRYLDLPTVTNVCLRSVEIWHSWKIQVFGLKVQSFFGLLIEKTVLPLRDFGTSLPVGTQEV